jgi:hypothetical protein
MDLKKTWDKMQMDQFSIGVLDDKDILEAMHQKSHGPIQKIQTGFTIKLAFIVLFTFVFLYIGIKVKEPLVSGLQFFMAGVYFSAFFLFLSQNKRIKAGIPMDEGLLTNLKNYHAFVSRVLRQEERIALFIYPVALTAGFLLGFTTEATLDEFSKSRTAIVLLVACWIVLTPLSHLLARWMNKASFGKYLNELESHIAELEKE